MTYSFIYDYSCYRYDGQWSGDFNNILFVTFLCISFLFFSYFVNILLFQEQLTNSTMLLRVDFWPPSSFDAVAAECFDVAAADIGDGVSRRLPARVRGQP